jgi:DNA-binding MarR family transcriptional regulator
MPELTTFRKMQRACQTIRKLYPDMPVTSVSVFLDVVLQPGISSRELMQNTGISQSAVSRHMSILGPYNWRGEEGLKLIESIEDPEDRRQKISFLTAKGRQLAIDLFSIMEPDRAPPSHDDFPTATNYTKEFRSGLYASRR